jgi:hypothetical protein
MHLATKWFSVKVMAIGLISGLICIFPVSYAFADIVDYDIVYVRMPRNGDGTPNSALSVLYNKRISLEANQTEATKHK